MAMSAYQEEISNKDCRSGGSAEILAPAVLYKGTQSRQITSIVDGYLHTFIICMAHIAPGEENLSQMAACLKHQVCKLMSLILPALPFRLWQRERPWSSSY